LSVIPEVPDRHTTRRSRRRDTRARVRGDIGEATVSVVVIQNARFLVAATQMLAVDFGIDVAIYQNQIGPAVVVEVKEHRAPSQILRVEAQPGGSSRVGESSVAV